MIKTALFSVLVFTMPVAAFGFAGGGLSGYYDIESNDSSNDEDSDTGQNATSEEEQIKIARFRTDDGEAHVIKTNGSGVCLQSPTNKLYKELSPNPNRVVDFLNKEFGPSDSGAKWYIVSC